MALPVLKMGFERAEEDEQARLGELLWDIHGAAMKIEEFTSGRGFEDFAGSELLQSAVAAMLGIIAASLRQLGSGFPDELGKLGDVQPFLAAENLNPEPAWRLVEERVPGLLAEARTLLESWHHA